MNLWILDTDCFSLFQRGNSNIIERVTNTRPEQLAITIITVEEQIRGRLNVIRRFSGEKTVLAYGNLKNFLEDIQDLNILDFTNEANNYYQKLIQQKIRVGTRDSRIAAIALSVNATIVTRNYRDFQKIPNLVVEDWS